LSSGLLSPNAVGVTYCIDEAECADSVGEGGIIEESSFEFCKVGVGEWGSENL
jgi:hypothetical protein